MSIKDSFIPDKYIEDYTYEELLDLIVEGTLFLSEILKKVARNEQHLTNLVSMDTNVKHALLLASKYDKTVEEIFDDLSVNLIEALKDK